MRLNVEEIWQVFGLLSYNFFRTFFITKNTLAFYDLFLTLISLISILCSILLSLISGSNIRLRICRSIGSNYKTSI
jgi:hypothetical protein